MVEMFHPSQLEQRFGGTMPTPTNFWPPYMGTEFIPEHEKAEKHNLINPEDYSRVLAENPELLVHPSHMTPERHENMHFKFET